jgi:hypothetical protein
MCSSVAKIEKKEQACISAFAVLGLNLVRLRQRGALLGCGAFRGC